MSQEIIVALDWTPNGNHCGLFVAKALGLYDQAGLKVTLNSVHTTNYEVTPAMQLTDNKAHIGLCPSESVISFYTWPENSKPRIRGIATLFQKDLSCLVTLKESGIDKPAKLDGKTYASYGARYEGRILQQMIRNDGGKGEYTEKIMPPLEIWDSVLKGESDATWVFKTCENIDAQERGVELNSMFLEDYNIPYCYSPILIARNDYLEENGEAVKKFLKATGQGFKHCIENVEEAAQMFVKAVEEEYAEQPFKGALGVEHLKKSLASIKGDVLDENGKWGKMEAEQWRKFIDWLHDSGLLTTMVQSREPVEGVSSTLDELRAGNVGDLIPREKIKDEELFTNEYLE